MDHTLQHQVEFPITNKGHNVLRLPNSSVNHWRGHSIWTHPYWPQPAHSHSRDAIPSSTRGMPCA